MYDIKQFNFDNIIKRRQRLINEMNNSKVEHDDLIETINNLQIRANELDTFCVKSRNEIVAISIQINEYSLNNYHDYELIKQRRELNNIIKNRNKELIEIKNNIKALTNHVSVLNKENINYYNEIAALTFQLDYDLSPRTDVIHTNDVDSKKIMSQHRDNADSQKIAQLQKENDELREIMLLHRENKDLQRIASLHRENIPKTISDKDKQDKINKAREAATSRIQESAKDAMTRFKSKASSSNSNF